MKDYSIVTDVACDLNYEILKENQIEVIPMSYELDSKVYNYKPELGVNLDDFYAALKDCKTATTSQTNMIDVAEKFNEILSKGKDVFCISFSSALSGNFNAARIVADEINEKYADNKVTVIDSLAASSGQGLLVYYAALNKAKGLSLEENVDDIEKKSKYLCHIFTVDDLYYLKRGGRVSSATALIGTMMSIKPIMHVNNEGKLVPIGKVRSRAKSLRDLFDRIKENAIDIKKQPIFISYAGCKEDAEKIVQLIKDETGNTNVRINEISPIVGVHSGPGTVAVFFIGHKR